MQNKSLVCKWCGSIDLFEKEVNNVHKIGVWCKDCERHLKWGKIINYKEEHNMFEVNHSEAYQGSKLMKEGEYEIIVKSALETATKAGTTYINMALVVRNDVEQNYKNKHIWHVIWKNKETQKYNIKSFNTIAKALNIPNGTKFNNLEEILKAFDGKVARVTVKHEEYKGNTNERVAFWNESKHKDCKHVFANQPQTQEQKTDDLPF